MQMCSSVTEDFGSHANFHNAIEVLFIGGRYRFFHAFLFRRGETVVLEATKAKSAMDYMDLQRSPLKMASDNKFASFGARPFSSMVAG